MKIFHQQSRGAQLCGKYDSGSEEVKVEYERMETNDSLQVYDETKKPRLKKVGRLVVAVIIIMAFVFLILCVLIASDRRQANSVCSPVQVNCCAKSTGKEENCSPKQASRNGNDKDLQILKASANRTRLRMILMNMTSSIHLAGTSANNHLREVIVHHLRSSSFRSSATQIYKYNVMLSYPNWEKPNTVKVFSPGFTPSVTRPPATNWKERPWDHPEVFTSFVAYSTNATVTGRLLEANYGEEEDYGGLNEQSWMGSVVLIRLRERHLCRVVEVANQRGVGGVLLFVDDDGGQYQSLTATTTPSSSSSPSLSSPSTSLSSSSLTSAPLLLNNSHSNLLLITRISSTLTTSTPSSITSSSSLLFSSSSSSSPLLSPSLPPSLSRLLLGGTQSFQYSLKTSLRSLLSIPISSSSSPSSSSSSSTSSSKDEFPERNVPRATLWHMGDPMTPELPSKEGMIGSEEEEVALPNIPVQTIGLQTAKYLMGLLSNQSRISDGKANPIHVTLEVFNSLERRDIFNVVTRIEGSEEPDRYIIVGCRYDAWSYGAMEGNSGSSILLEVSSALSKLVSNDWKPRRTILLIHWDAGEMGEVGSTEWVEEHRLELLDRAVAYVNLDSCVTGLWSPKAEINPLLRSFFVDLIPNLELSNFNSQFSNLFDFWISRNPSENDPYLPRIDPPSTASDQLPFLYYFGLPTIWPQLIDQFPLRTNRLRHTSLSSFQHVEQHVDPKFKGHELMTHLTLELIHKMSTSVKLPFDVREMAESLERDFNSLGADALDDLKTSLDQLQKAIREFSIASVLFHDNFQQLDENDRYVQMCNERLMKVSKSFVPRDLPRRNKRYFLSELSSSSVDSFGLFSMLRDSIENYLRRDSSSSSPSTPSSSSPPPSSSSVVWKMESPAAPPSSSHSPFAETTSSSTVTTTNTFFGGRKTTSKWSRMLLLRQISATTLAIESATRILDFPEEYE